MPEKYTDEEWSQIEEEATKIIDQFIENMSKSPNAVEVIDTVKDWQSHISKYYYDCDPEIFYGVGLMYISDDDYRNSLNSKKDGLAPFMSKAIIDYCTAILKEI